MWNLNLKPRRDTSLIASARSLPGVAGGRNIMHYVTLHNHHCITQVSTSHRNDSDDLDHYDDLDLEYDDDDDYDDDD